MYNTLEPSLYTDIAVSCQRRICHFILLCCVLLYSTQRAVGSILQSIQFLAKREFWQKPAKKNYNVAAVHKRGSPYKANSAFHDPSLWGR